MGTPPVESSGQFWIIKMSPAKVCIFPQPKGLGGPAAFSARLSTALEQRGISVTTEINDSSVSAVLVMGGSRHLNSLRRAKKRGARLVQRLNGMNWVHRQAATGLRHYLRAEINNWILATIRARLADRIIYQSNFTQDWWQRVYRTPSALARVIYNGVDLKAYSPEGTHQRPQEHIRILAVEGRYGGGYDIGLENALSLVNALNQAQPSPRFELLVAGQVPEQTRARIQATGAWVTWAGVVPREHIPALDRSAHLLFSADLNAACPNAVIEALACGLPVAAYATGALPEMLQGGAGLCVPYGRDYWKLQKPQVEPLAQAVQQIAAQQPTFRQAARQRAEAAFDINAVMEQYLEALLG